MVENPVGKMSTLWRKPDHYFHPFNAPSQRPGFHIFVGSKAPWHEITDELPQFETRPTA